MSKVNSSFWLDKSYQSFDSPTNKQTTKDVKDLIQLSGVKTAVSNFVGILTGESIPVKFKQSGDSYTDGKSVVLSGTINKDKDFDVMVGLALHEGSHIVMSDFDILKQIPSSIPLHLKTKAKEKKIDDYNKVVKQLTNYVEDRRIDYFVFTESPGYREYYRSMYDKYFNHRLISKTIKSNEYTTETLESYMFRIINLHSKESNLSKLRGLRDIYKAVDLKNISRLKSSQDSFDVALQVFEIILNNIETPVEELSDDKTSGDGGSEGQESTPQTPQSGMEEDENDESSSQSIGSTGNGFDKNSNDESNDTEGGSNPEDSEESEQTDSDDSGSNGKDSEESDTDSKPNDGIHRDESKDLDDDAPELTERQKGIIKKKIERQERFLDGDIRKGSLTKQDIEFLDEVTDSETKLVRVGEDENLSDSYKINKGVDVIVVEKLTDSLFESSHFPLVRRYRGSLSERCKEEVETGLKKGRILAKKLQVRSEERTTIFNRQKSGRMDKRMIASLGFGNENVFTYRETDSFNDLNLHVSIDASGSMVGKKWSKTLENITTLIQAVDIIPNLEIQVTMRTTDDGLPYIVKVYDSTEDTIMKVKKMFPFLYPNGTTPEGLTFEAIMDKFISGTNNRDSYFLNISDGEPYYIYTDKNSKLKYQGKQAVKHTKKQVNKIRQRGIKVLSFFVSSHYDSYPYRDDFTEMYGEGAKFIDIQNIKQITRTMNRFFLKK